ncbi:hypothetical protein CLV62_12523 [Dysgonomonas alginatilytica]|uniref:Uncharacterized protein n=1 Tax=Dysgonomonas alginatilytica TaxID=1605892 RepID=A0A2V3PMR7_9BACT|nr:hypothetical protein [Dysgonomonas alginatilytica]PXV61190.1 hypothetical protein CLV62_12523 [Dysgonomonas alginatilytica]
MILYLIQTLLQALVISLCCVAIHVTTWKGMILHSTSKTLDKSLRAFFRKFFYMSEGKSWNLTLYLLTPIYRCIICMSSFWTIMFWFFWNFNLGLMILVVCGINTIITAIISNLLPDE